MNAPDQVSSGVRQVLTAPRGHRFTHTRTGTGTRTGAGTGTGPTPPATLEEFFGQPTHNPRVRQRMEHGEFPHWMALHAARLAERDAPTPEEPRKPSPPRDHPPAPVVPRPHSAPDDGLPKPPPPRPPRPPRPPLPRRPHSHRKPRRKLPWTLIGYTLAATAGALAHHLSTLLL